MSEPASHAQAHVEALRTSLSELVYESQALRGDVHTAEAARRRANQINLGVLGLLALFVAMLMVVTWQNNRLAQQVNETNSRMSDCTTPGGKCYEDGRTRTSKAITDILRVNVYMAECSRLYPGESGPEFDKELEACIYARLGVADQQPQPTPAPSAQPAPTAGG